MNIDNIIKNDSAIQLYIKSLPKELLKQAVPLSIKKSSTLVIKGEPLEAAYILLSGELGIIYYALEGKSHLYSSLSPFKIISDVEVLAQENYYCSTVISVKDSILYRIPIEHFKNCLNTNSDFSKEVIHTFAKSAYHNSLLRGMKAYKSSLDKTAIHLLMFCMAHPPTDAKPVIIKKTRQTLAEELELSVKTINRNLDALKEEGYISIVHGKIHVRMKHFDLLKEKWYPII